MTLDNSWNFGIGKRNLFDDDNSISFGEHEDDYCNISFDEKEIILTGDPKILALSYRNFTRIKNENHNQLNKYLPKYYIIENDKIIIDLDKRAIPLCKIEKLEQVHANWILSRLIEFIALLSQQGYSHLGINPDSIYVIPEIHGIIPISFYYSKKLGEAINNNVSNKYYLYYPINVLSNNKASYYIDFELAKKTIVNSLDGDFGPKLKEKYNSDFVDFLLKFNKDKPIDVFKEYRRIIEKNFEKRFIKFDI